MTWSGPGPGESLDPYPGCSVSNSVWKLILLFWPSEFLSLSLFGIGYKITHFGSGCELLLNCCWTVLQAVLLVVLDYNYYCTICTSQTSNPKCWISSKPLFPPFHNEKYFKLLGSVFIPKKVWNQPIWKRLHT